MNLPAIESFLEDNLSWYQALAFCRWLGVKIGYEVDLPHEYEWGKTDFLGELRVLSIDQGSVLRQEK